MAPVMVQLDHRQRRAVGQDAEELGRDGAQEHLREDAEPRRSAGKGRLDAHRAGLRIGHRQALREADQPAGQEDQQRREIAGQDQHGLAGKRMKERIEPNSTMVSIGTRPERWTEIQLPRRVADRKHQEIEPVFEAAFAEDVFHQERRGRGDGEEGEGQRARLQYIGDEAAAAEQRRVMREHASVRPSGLSAAMLRLEQHEIGQSEDRGAGDQREPERRAPAEDIDQQPAEGRRDHRPDRIGHGEIGDGLDQHFRSVSVAGDGAGEGEAAAGADRLDDAADDQHRRPMWRKPRVRCRARRARGRRAAPGGGRSDRRGCHRTASRSPS